MGDARAEAADDEEGAPREWVQGEVELVAHTADPGVKATSPSAPFGRTLRIALAMKGGVSLAVWIGGAVTELDVLRRIRLTGTAASPGAEILLTWCEGDDPRSVHRDVIARATCYAELLIARRYDGVEIDVLAGASAGGLNAVLYGVAQRVGAGTDDVLEVWRTSGDAWRLLREPQPRSIDSILRGDDYFWGEMVDALTAVHDSPARHDELVAPVSVDLSATIIDGETSPERGIREGKAHFHFSGGTETHLAGRLIPALGDAHAREAIERLAYAARTTSSFPGAFEPALIYSGVGESRDGAVDMRHAFHAHRALRIVRQRTPSVDAEPLSPVTSTLDPFRVVDGGVTDNVPIDRALRAVRDRSADRYVNRAMIYLDPSPNLQFDGLVRPTDFNGQAPSRGATEVSQRRDDPRSTFVGVVASSVAHMLKRESKDDEVDDVEDFRRVLYLEQAKDEVFGPITEPKIPRVGGGDPVHVSRAYARFRSVADLDLLVRVLSAPSLWQLTTANPDELHFAWSREQLRLLESEIFQRFEVATDERLEGIMTGPQASVDACRCLLTWVRAIEDGAFWHGDAFSLEPLDRQIWRRVMSSFPRPQRLTRGELRNLLHTSMAAAVRRRDAAMSAVLTAADAQAVVGPQDAKAVASAIVSAWADSGNTPVSDDEWSKLDRIVTVLRAVSRELDQRVGNSEAKVVERGGEYERAADWPRSPWSGIGRTVSPFGARDLAPLVAARGMPMVMPAMKYEDITAAEPVGDPAAYATLMEAQMLEGYRALLKLSVTDARLLAPADSPEGLSPSVTRLMPDDRLRPRTKLAGMRLFNFAGFLSKEWRTNDWWWGRIDAAHGIIDVLESFTAIPPASDAAQVSLHAVRRWRVEDSVIDQWRDAPASTPGGRAEFRASIGRSIEGVNALDPSYRLAIASRVLRLASQAITRRAGVLSLRRVVQWMLRPLLVFLPLGLAPARLAIVAAVIAAPFIALAEPVDLSPLAVVTGVALSLITVGLVVRTVYERVGRRVALRRAIGAQRWRYVRYASGRAAWTGGLLMALALALVVWALLPTLMLGSTGPGTWVLLLAALGLAFGANRRFLVPASSAEHRVARTIVALAFAALVTGGAWWVHACTEAQIENFEPWAQATVAASVGAVLTWTLTYGWLFGRAPCERRGEAFGIFFVMGLAAGAAAGVIWFSPPLTGLLSYSAGEVEWISLFYPTVISFWLWGFVAWWLPAIWKSPYTPDDTPAGSVGGRG